MMTSSFRSGSTRAGFFSMRPKAFMNTSESNFSPTNGWINVCSSARLLPSALVPAHPNPAAVVGVVEVVRVEHLLDLPQTQLARILRRHLIAGGLGHQPRSGEGRVG